jgi:hypothetical protein
MLVSYHHPDLPTPSFLGKYQRAMTVTQELCAYLPSPRAGHPGEDIIHKPSGSQVPQHSSQLQGEPSYRETVVSPLKYSPPAPSILCDSQFFDFDFSSLEHPYSAVYVFVIIQVKCFLRMAPGEPGLMARTCNPSTQKAEAGRL